MWQDLHAELSSQGLTIITVALDADAEAARPFIERAKPEHPALIDRDHIVADRFGILNVPTAVWVDETGKIVLESGAYYEMMITADGSAELAIEGPGFLRAIWIDEIVINKIEVRPMAIDSMEFDAAGEAEISFIPIKPGRYELRIRGAKADSQKLMIQIK